MERADITGYRVHHLFAKWCQSVILARRPEFALFPFMLKQTVFLQPAEQWIDRAFHYDQLGLAQACDDIAGIDRFPAEPEHAIREETLSHLDGDVSRVLPACCLWLCHSLMLYKVPCFVNICLGAAVNFCYNTLMNKKTIRILRVSLLMSLPAALIITGIVSLVPYQDAVTAGMTGVTTTLFGLPFAFFAQINRSIPGGSTLTEFDLYSLITNVIIIYLLTFLVVVLIKSKRITIRKKTPAAP